MSNPNVGEREFLGNVEIHLNCEELSCFAATGKGVRSDFYEEVQSKEMFGKTPFTFDTTRFYFFCYDISSLLKGLLASLNNYTRYP